MNSKIFKNKNFLSIFLALIVFIIVFFLNFDLLNKNLQKLFNIDGSIDDRIVVVKIDDNTVRQLGRFPFDRKYYVQLIENLNKAGATVIGFDIMFADKTGSDNELADKTGSDNEFAEAIKNAGNIVLGGGTIKETTQGLFEEPRNIFTSGALLVGTFDVSNDAGTNTVFSVAPYKNFTNGYYDYFGVSILKAYYSSIFKDESILNIKSLPNNNIINIKDKIIFPISYKNYNDVLINFSSKTFNEYSFIDIYNEKNFLGKLDDNGEQFLKDKIVIVGSTLRGKDIFKTPIGEDYGVFVHANFINTVLTKNFSIYFNRNLELILIFLLTVLAIYLNLNKGGKLLIISNITIIGIIFAYFIVLKNLRLVSTLPFELILAILLSTVISNIVKYIIENKDKTKLNTALSEYVSKDIADEILSGEGNINLEGDKKRIAIFFSDIEGFTTISESFSPEKLISFLKDYLSEMSEIIFSNKGFVNKYEGDAIMALRGVFEKEPGNISKSACDTALLQKQRLIEFNEKWTKKGLPLIKVRIGINTGEAIIGNIGYIGKKLEFTAIGDNVNLASRLESINKFYSTYICVSESVYNETKDLFEYRYLDKIKVKGKNIALNIYELLSNKGKLKKKEKDIYTKFGKGITFYLNRDFDKALELFVELSELGDPPSFIYKERCLTYIKNPPLDNWDKVWTMTEK